MLERLERYGIDKKLIDEIRKFREFYKVDEKVKNRVTEPNSFFYGRKVWQEAIYAVLNSDNILLVGNKATGKNLLADNLSYVFGRPKWTASFHNYIDEEDLIGVDTFKNNEVIFRNGIITECAVHGGFGILDEINMAKNDALSVLYSALDYRRVIDIAGYNKVDLHEATRFIATINYGYIGTKELNEALVSRFVVIRMPKLNENMVLEILEGQFENIDEGILKIFARVFVDLQEKAENGEISSRAVDLRGVIDSIKLMNKGMKSHDALNLSISNKIFDDYERQIVEDVIKLRVDEDLKW